MSNPFDRPSGPDGPSGPQRPGSGGPGGPAGGGARPVVASRRPGALVITAIILVLAFMLLSGFASFWTERLWFGSVGFQGVFTTLLLTRIGLFLVFAGLMAATVATAMALAYRFRPVLFPGIFSGALFAFVTSFDEVVVALFLTGPQDRTLPRQMFDGIRENISPIIAAAATLLIVLSVALMTVMEALRRRSERLRGLR